jgi:fructan beta-fructosidase
LFRDQNGLTLKQEPVLRPLRAGSTPISMTSASGLIAAQAVPYELNLQFRKDSRQIFGVRVYSDEHHLTEIGFDTQRGEFYIDRTKSGLTVAPEFPAKTVAPLVAGRPYDLTLVVDRSSIEAYAQSGTIVMTNLLYPPSQNNRIELFSENGKPVTVTGKLWKLRSIWN